MPSYTFPFILQSNTNAATDAVFINGSWQFNGIMSSITFSDDDTAGLGDPNYGSESGSSAIITHVDGSTTHPLVGQPIHMTHVRADNADGDGDTDADVVFLTTDDGTGLDTFGVVQYPGSGWSMNSGDTFTSSNTDLPTNSPGGGAWTVEGFPQGTVAEAECIFYDAIVHAGAAVGVGETMSTADGDLLAVHEAVSMTLINPPFVGANDTVVINGVPWNVVDASNQQANIVHDGGTTSTFVASLELTNGTDVMTYYMPSDGGTYNNITSITPTSTPSFLPPNCNTFDSDDSVSLSFPTPDPALIYDFIMTSVPMPTDGDTLTHANGDLVAGVEETVQFGGGANPNNIEPGDLMYVGDSVYQITGMQVNNVTFTYDGGSVATTNVLTIEVTDGTDTWSYFAPVDGQQYPDITDVAVNTTFAAPGTGYANTIFDADDNVNVICFAEGTSIATINGACNVEALEIGDRVLTADNGYQEIQWIGKRTVQAQGDLAPIVISKGTFGCEKDLRVSPQHRIMISDWRAELLFGANEALVAAKHLVNGETIYRQSGGDVTYYHVLFDNHEIIFSDGVATESFHPGEHSVAGLADETRAELFELFPELEAGDFGRMQSARISLKSFEVDALYA